MTAEVISFEMLTVYGEKTTRQTRHPRGSFGRQRFTIDTHRPWREKERELFVIVYMCLQVLTGDQVIINVLYDYPLFLGKGIHCLTVPAVALDMLVMLYT